MASVLEHRVLSLSAVLSLCCSLSILQLRVGGRSAIVWVLALSLLQLWWWNLNLSTCCSLSLSSSVYSLLRCCCCLVGRGRQRVHP